MASWIAFSKLVFILRPLKRYQLIVYSLCWVKINYQHDSFCKNGYLRTIPKQFNMAIRQSSRFQLQRFSKLPTVYSSFSLGDELRGPQREFWVDVLPPQRGPLCRTSRPTPCPRLSPRCLAPTCPARRGSHEPDPRPGRQPWSLVAQEEPRATRQDWDAL